MSLSSGAFLAVADRIGNRLCRDAIWSGDRCNWLGWTLIAHGSIPSPGYRAQGVALQDGIAGIAWFFAWLHHFTGDPLHARTLHGALRQLDRALADPANGALALPASGFHNGAAGVAAACMQIGELLHDDGWLARGLRVLDGVARDAALTNAHDVVNGAAGSIPVLLRVHARFDLSHLASAAKQLADDLLDVAAISTNGAAWPVPDGGVTRPFLGYAHGAGGMACALLDLDRALDTGGGGGERYRAAALAALRDERRHLASIDTLGWSDGASSVACALLEASELLRANGQLAQSRRSDASAAARARVETEDAAALGPRRAAAARPHPAAPGPACNAEDLCTALDAEADALLHGIARRLADAQPWAHTFCLYRGLAGCADVLLAGAARLRRPALRQAAEMLGELGIVHFDRPRMPWPCGVPGIGGSPNLMMGLAGIGYLYLRLHQPHVVPSVLVPDTERTGARVAADDFTNAPAALLEAP